MILEIHYYRSRYIVNILDLEQESEALPKLRCEGKFDTFEGAYNCVRALNYLYGSTEITGIRLPEPDKVALEDFFRENDPDVAIRQIGSNRQSLTAKPA